MHASKRILAASVVTLLWASGMAAAQDSGPYASVFGGANFNHDTDFNIVSSDPSLTGFSSLPGTMYFDAGGVIGGAVGSVFPFIIMLVILFIRPTGMFGWRTIDRV